MLNKRPPQSTADRENRGNKGTLFDKGYVCAIEKRTLSIKSRTSKSYAVRVAGAWVQPPNLEQLHVDVVSR